MTIIRKLIRTDGTEAELPGALSNDAIGKLIGAETMDVVPLHQFGPLHVMFVDDNGYEVEEIQHSPTHFERRPVRALKPVNVKATQLYHANCKPGTTHQIIGDVVVVPDEDFA